jgi:hypothetical protein
VSPSDPCDTCAFGKAGAATEPHNALKAQISALGGIPFFCHHAPDGRELNWRGSPADYWASMASKKDARVCAGWKREVAAQRRLFRGPYNVIRRAVAESALDALAAFLWNKRCGPQMSKEKLEAHRHIKRALRFLTSADVGPLKIPFFKNRRPASGQGR